VSGPTPQQLRGLVLLLAAVAVWLLWRLLSLRS
jgi:hypothetical protein